MENQMKIQLLKMKADLKSLAKEIRTLKSTRKEHKGHPPGLYSAQHTFRSGHIAYCMLRGRKLEEIEPKLRDPNSYIHASVRKEAARIIASVLEAHSATTQP
jgi:hypothetical protein